MITLNVFISLHQQRTRSYLLSKQLNLSIDLESEKKHYYLIDAMEGVKHEHLHRVGSKLIHFHFVDIVCGVLVRQFFSVPFFMGAQPIF